MAPAKRSRIVGWAVTGTVLAVTIGAVVASSRTPSTASADEVPLAEVKRGDIDLDVHTTGELRASHAMMMTAPAVGGDALQLTHLAHTGEAVKKGDVIFEFDPSQQVYKLEQNRSELEQAQQEIVKAKADAAVLAAEDKVALLTDRYNVRRAQLDVQKNELLSKIDADKNVLALAQAERVLAQQEKDIVSHTQFGQAALYLAQEKYNKAKLGMDQAQKNLEKMRVTAPMDGLVSIQKNTNAAGGFFFTGMTLPDYREGDQVQPGSAIAQIVDPHGLDLTASLGEQDRDNVKVAGAVGVTFDALPGQAFQGHVKRVGGISMPQFFSGNTGGSFSISIELDKEDPRLRSGFTGRLVFHAGRQKDVLYVPRVAIFLKDGKRVVYLKKSTGYEQREVKIQSQNESQAVVSALKAGDLVFMIDPTLPRKANAGSSTANGLGGAL